MKLCMNVFSYPLPKTSVCKRTVLLSTTNILCPFFFDVSHFDLAFDKDLVLSPFCSQYKWYSFSQFENNFFETSMGIYLDYFLTPKWRSVEGNATAMTRSVSFETSSG